MAKFNVGDIVIIRNDIKEVCEERRRNGLYTDTVSQMLVHAGKKYRVHKVLGPYDGDDEYEQIYGYRLINVNTNISNEYVWYDFHLMREHTIALDVNKVVNI